MTDISRYRTNDPRDASEIASVIETELQSLRPSAPVIEGTENYALIQSLATTLAEQQEASLVDLYDAAYVVDSTGVELTKNARELGVKRQDAIAATGVVKFTRDSAATTDYTIPSGTTVGTGGDDNVTFVTTESTTINSGTSSAKANVECTETGPVGNVGAGTVTVLVEKPTGVDSVTNPNPIGDPTYTLTDGSTALTSGRAEESDASLRERALESTAIGGAGTAEAVELALDNIDEVRSADVLTNRTNGTVQNVDPWHTEVRVYGGETTTIANRLYEVSPVATLLTLQGGANGTKESVTIDGGDLYGDITIPITRPTTTTLTIEIDVVHDATYAGTSDTKNAIVDYVGGEDADTRVRRGLVQGENVLVNEIENVVEDVNGVDYANVTLLDANGDGTDDTTTDANGVPIYDVGASEVAIVNASDVTVTETAR